MVVVQKADPGYIPMVTCMTSTRAMAVKHSVARLYITPLRLMWFREC